MFDPNSPEAIAARAHEERVRPAAEKICGQYLRGLLTHDELVCALSELWVSTPA